MQSRATSLSPVVAHRSRDGAHAPAGAGYRVVFVPASRAAELGIAPPAKSGALRDASKSAYTGSMLASVARRILTVAQPDGVLRPTDLFFLGTHIDRLLGGGIMPGFLTDGPIRDGIILAIAGKSLIGRIASFQDALANGPAAPAATSVVQATAGVRALGILGTLSTALLKASSAMRAVDHFLDHGTAGLLTTRSGRSAALGAGGAASWLVGMALGPATVAGLGASLIGTTLWALSLMNSQGTFDYMLGKGDDREQSENMPLMA